MNANLHDNRHTPDTLVVIDTYDWYENDRKEGEQTDARNEAMLLTSVANTHGRRVEFETITNEKDKERTNSYKHMDHNVHSMNGSRPTELIEVITGLIGRVNYERPRKVIVVGDHDAFQLLCSAAEQNGAQIQIWTPGTKIPPRLRAYEIHPLDTLLPALRKTKRTVVVRLDVENHLITLHKRGSAPDTHTYLEAVRTTIADLGNIINIQAWADWERLRQSLGRDYQREFEENGVKTFYQINEPGKSTSDMAMVGSIHESLDHENGLDIYVLGTGDADFTPAVESIRNQGKKAVVLTLEGSIGHKLKKAADEVRFLDAHFSMRISAHPPVTSHRPGSSKGLVATLVVANILRTRHWQYVFMDRLPNWLQVEWVGEALETGLLLHRDATDRNAVVLNMDNPMARQAAYFERWVQRQIYHYLVTRSRAYVDTGFLARGMQMDNGCKELNIGQNRNSAIVLLEAGAEARLLVRKTMQHPKYPNVQIVIWSLPAKDTTTERQETDRPKEHDDKIPEALNDVPVISSEKLRDAQPVVEAKTDPKAF